MGSIYGLINIIIVVWFYASAVSVKKPAFKWAVIGALSFLAFKFFGYSLIAILQDSLAQANLGVQPEQGYTIAEKNFNELSKVLTEDQSTKIGIFYEFLPLLIALIGVSIIRAKFILRMGYFASLLHRTPLKYDSRKSI